MARCSRQEGSQIRRTLLTAVLGVAAALAMATTASADIGDIRNLSVDDPVTGTAELAEVSGEIRCTTTIEYGLIVAVAQPESEEDSSFLFDEEGEPLGPEQDIQGVGAFGPNAGNEANSPCTTNLKSYEVVVERNRDSGTFQDSDDCECGIDVIVAAGTSAENGDRGPGPFIGDFGLTAIQADFNRTDP